MSILLRAGAIAVAGLIVAGAVADAEARDRRRSGTFEGSNGRSGSFEQSIHRERGAVNRRTVVQGENGRSASREVQRRFDRDAQSIDTTIVNEGPRGNTRITNQTTRRTSDGQIITDRHVLGSSGREATGQRIYTPNGDGSGGTVSGSYDTSRGRSVDWSGSVSRGEDGVVRQGEYQTGEGRSGTYSGQFQRTDTGFVREQSVTNQDGQIRTRGVEGVWDPETRTYTRSVTATGPDGETRSRSIDVTLDPPTD